MRRIKKLEYLFAYNTGKKYPQILDNLGFEELKLMDII